MLKFTPSTKSSLLFQYMTRGALKNCWIGLKRFLFLAVLKNQSYDLRIMKNSS
jgi:hypothetical protein